MNKTSLRIGLIHLAVAHKKPDLNRKSLLELLNRAIEEGAKIIVMPEMAISGYSFRSRNDILLYAESERGLTVSWLTQIAKKASIYICFGMAERDENTGILYNSAFVIGPEGKILCRYRKISAESRWACAGNPNQNNTFETPWGRMGILICADSYYGLITRCTAIRGARLIIIIANWPPSGLDPRELWRARAIENGLFLVACNRAGFDLTMDCCNAPSCVYDPMGNVIFEGMGKESKLFLVDIPLDSNGKLREDLRRLQLMKRPLELYRDCTLNLWPVRDLTSFLGLPTPGVLPILCVVPELGKHPLWTLKKALKHVQPKRGSLLLLPAFKTDETIIEDLKTIAMSKELGIIWRDPSMSDFCGHLITWDGKLNTWRRNLFTTNEEELFPEFDFSCARVSFAPFDLIKHPEFATATAKRGCDIVLASEEFLEKEWKLLGGVRTIENLAIAACGINGAGIWTTPQGHERWGEVLASEGESCAMDLDTSLTREKRFQDRVDFELLLSNGSLE
ncbi:MAG: hypothetical protein N2260_10280 [Syntrophobacterales bacterium]|nr:hypothetical protein [Syntrophobacterales bacterium]